MSAPGRVFTVGPYEVDEARGEVRLAGDPVAIHATPLRLLLYLLRHRDRTVSRTELLDRVWPGVAVSDGALSAALKEARRAVGDDGHEQAVIQTQRGQGYRIVAPVDERTAERSLRVAAADFVGREDVLAELGQALEASLGGSGGVVIVSGEAGIGKTRTAVELLREAGERGVRAHTVGCMEGGGAPSYWPWVRLLRVLADEPEALPASLAKLVAELRGDEEADPALEPGEARFRLFDAIARFLRGSAADRGLVLVLDDVQWADASSLALLGFLAAGIGGTRLLVVCTVREVDEDELPVARCLADLARQATCTRIRLDGLARPDVAALLAALGGAAADDDRVDEVYERTDGNPFFVRELATAGYEGEGVPRGVREVIRGRWLRLPDACRETLAVASALGVEFGDDLLARVTGLAPAELAGHLEEARRVELVCEGSTGAHRFVHALVREAVEAEQPPAERVRIHRRVALALEAMAGPEPGPLLGELARHFERAGEPARASGYAERAGSRALALPAFEAAAGHFEQALRLREAAAAPELERRCDLLLALAEARGAEGRSDLLRDACRRAASLARELGRGACLARAATRFVGGNFTVTADPEGAALLEAALEALGPEDSPERALVLARLGFTRLGLREPERAEALVRSARECAERLDDPAALGWVAAIDGAMGIQLAFPPEAAIASYERALALGTAAGDRALVRALHSWMLQPLLHLGEPERAAACAVALRQWAPWDAAASTFVALHEGHRALLAGRLDEADEHVEEALSRSQGLGIVLLPLAQRYLVRREQGRLGELASLVEQLVREQPALEELRVVRAHLLAELGTRDGAQADLGRLVDHELESLSRAPASLVKLAEVADLLGDADRAAVLYERLRPWAPYHALDATLGAFWGPVARALGVLATVLGCYDDAEQHFDAALALCRRMDATLWELRTLHDRARMLLARGDHERAREEVRAALAGARRLSLPALQRSLEDLASELEGAVPLHRRQRTV